MYTGAVPHETAAAPAIEAGFGGIQPRLAAWHPATVTPPTPDGRFRLVADTSAIALDHAWARATAGASTTGAVYFTVTNAAGGQPDRLVGVNTPAAATAELHETIDDKGVMKMRPVPSIALNPGASVTLKPGGYHVMMMGVKQPLRAGTAFR